MTAEDPRQVVEEQENSTLWPQHPGIPESERVLQSELRRLHRAVEGSEDAIAALRELVRLWETGKSQGREYTEWIRAWDAARRVLAAHDRKRGASDEAAA